MYTGRHTRLHIRKNTLSTKDGVVELWTSHTGYTRHAITSSIISQCKNIFPWWGIYESKLRCDTRWALWSWQIEDTILNHRPSTMPINLAGMVSFVGVQLNVPWNLKSWAKFKCNSTSDAPKQYQPTWRVTKWFKDDDYSKWNKIHQDVENNRK
jgi:hypothetical protein